MPAAREREEQLPRAANGRRPTRSRRRRSPRPGGRRPRPARSRPRGAQQHTERGAEDAIADRGEEDVQGGLEEVVEAGGARPGAGRDAARRGEDEGDGARDDDLERRRRAPMKSASARNLPAQQAHPARLAHEQVAHRALAVLGGEGPANRQSATMPISVLTSTTPWTRPSGASSSREGDADAVALGEER